MNYEELKREIKEIAAIAESVPEAFRQKCFEVLLNKALAHDVGRKPAVPAEEQRKQTPPPADDVADENKDRAPSQLQLMGVVRAFMRRHSITDAQMEALVMLDGTEFHFIKEPTHREASRGQNEWALLVALRNGVRENNLRADPEEVRSIVQEKGYYDAKNFSSNFKKSKYAPYFREPLEPQGAAQVLANDGQTALAELIKSLVG